MQDHSVDPWRRPAPNDDVAAAIDALATQLPATLALEVSLLVLGSDTVRASVLGRSIDVTRPRSAERCHVTVHTPLPARRRFLRRVALVEHRAAHRYDVPVDELGQLLLPLHTLLLRLAHTHDGGS
ncbi:MAG: hypothetical protein ABSG43_01080 [Solirubrobacteraceae bacterium]|jgi:hypothetical protein